MIFVEKVKGFGWPCSRVKGQSLADSAAIKLRE